MTRHNMHDNLLLLNVPRTVATVIEVLSDGKPRSLHDIEREGDLRQPEVSIAVDALDAYLKIETHKRPGRGRAQKVVSMSRKAFRDYVGACVDCYKAAYDVAVLAGEELKGQRKW